MRYSLYTKTVDAWDAMLTELTSARHIILWESYIFLSDTKQTHNFVEILSEKARNGIKVVLLLDWFGSKNLPQSDEDRLTRAGVEVRYFTNIFRRSHRKMLIIDEKIAFLGGVNVGSDYRNWLDLHLKIIGPLVTSLTRSFAKAYRITGGEDSHVLAFQRKAVFGDAPYRFLEHLPGYGARRLKKYYQKKLREAKECVTIITPYFIPHPWLLESLSSAIARGVRVEIIIPEKADAWWSDLGNKSAVKEFSSRGFSFYFTKRMHHGKALLVDRHEALIGSQNIDALSFDHNFESGVAFTDPELIQTLEKNIAELKETSKTLPELALEPRWYDSIIHALVRFLHPIL